MYITVRDNYSVFIYTRGVVVGNFDSSLKTVLKGTDANPGMHIK